MKKRKNMKVEWMTPLFKEYKDGRYSFQINVGGALNSAQREYQQDRYMVKSHKFRNGSEALFFFIFDGHGASGHFVAEWCKKNMFSYVVKREQEFMNKKNTDYPFKEGLSLTQAFIDTDAQLKKVCEQNGWFTYFSEEKSKRERYKMEEWTKIFSGSTCNLVIIVPKKNDIRVVCANLGDSRAFMSIDGSFPPVFDDFSLHGMLSRDHDNKSTLEVQRAQKRGAVFKQARPNTPRRLAFYSPILNKYFGNLEPTRSFGNYEVKLGNYPRN